MANLRLLPDAVLPPIPQKLPVPPILPDGVTFEELIDDTAPHPSRGAFFAEWEYRVKYNRNIDRLEERLNRCSGDILEFAKEYFPDIFRAEFGSFHREITDLIFNLPEKEWYYVDQYGNQLQKQGIVVAAPRGFAKSTIITFLLPIYCAVFRIKRYVVIFSSNISGVAQFCTQIKREFEENEKLRADFGNLVGRDYGRQWGAHGFVVCHQGNDDNGDTTVGFEMKISGVTMGQNVRGYKFGSYRPDFILLDDAEKDENMANLDQRNKLQGLLMQRILPMLDPANGLFMMCGTMIHFDSLLARLMKAESSTGWVQRLWRCIIDNGARDVLDQNAESLWPEWWPINKLRSKRLTPPMTLHEWNTEYMNDPRDPENRDFLPEWVQWYTRGDNLRYVSKTGNYEWCKPGDIHPLTGKPRWQRLFIYQSVDPASGLNASNDFFTMITGGLSAETHDVVLIDLVRGHFSFAEQVNTIESQFMRFPMTIGCSIENYQYQDSLKQTIIAAQAKRYGVRKIPVRGMKHKTSRDGKIGRLRRRAWDMQTGTIWFPCLRDTDKGYATAMLSEDERIEDRVRVHPVIAPLYTEMMEFPKSRNDDTLDAFDMLMTIIGKRRLFGDYGEAQRESERNEESPLTKPSRRMNTVPYVNESGGAGVTTTVQRVGTRAKRTAR